MSDETRQFRSGVLASFGAGSAEIEELLAYNRIVFRRGADNGPTSLAPRDYPLPDELFVETWERYAREAAGSDLFEYLKRRLVQLQFPIKEGISETEAYQAATRRGQAAPAGPGLTLLGPEQITLQIHAAAAGRIPILTFGNREDFARCVQALTFRNKPVPIPTSMGACMVAGYNNWDRVREVWLQSDWKTRKESYQDRFILLSEGAYSGVSAASLGLDDETWLKLSLVIRREHECAHYFTRRIFSSMQNNVIDELIADYAGLTAATGSFRADWFLRFLGVESYPAYRERGRLENYRGNLSASAFQILQGLIVRAAANVERFQHAAGSLLSGPLATLVFTGFTLEELASDSAPALLGCSLNAHLEAIGASQLF